jgi:hypothetical protein
MSSSPMISAIATINNNGVSCFQSGDLDASLSLFRQALEAVATSLLPDEDGEGRRASQGAALPLTPPEKGEDRRRFVEAASSSSASSSAAKRSRDATLRIVASNPNEGAGSIAQVTNAYTRPIHLIPLEGSYSSNHTAPRRSNANDIDLSPSHTVCLDSLGAYSPDPLVNAVMMSSILLFNVAVVFHAKGCGETTGEGSERTYLERARDLYRKALGLLQPGHGPGRAQLTPSHHHPVLDVLSMALPNNVAAASYALGDYDACRTSVELLVQSCSRVMSDERRRLLDPEAASVLEWHTHLFMYNAYFLQTPPTVASAA